MKYYAVKVGKIPGVYLSWDECKAQVEGYPGAVYKSFKSKEDADAFCGSNGENSKKLPKSTVDAVQKSYAYVDGSFNVKTGVYGYGGFVYDSSTGEKHIVQGNGSDPEMASMRNVAGEVLGSTAAIKKAIELGIKELEVYYDYFGIEMWATGEWKRNKEGTKAYFNFIQSVKDKIHINFVKVKGHTGVAGNEEADQLAKQAVGIG